MIKIKNKFTLVIVILLAPVALIVLFVLVSLTISPIFDYFEKQRFITLDEEAQKINTAIKSAAGTDEAWKYNTGCGKNFTGAWPDGSYQCVTISYMEKKVFSADEVMRLHDKYYSTIENQDSLVAKRDLEFVHSDIFGKKFVVSSASKAYEEKKTGVSCRYESYLGQSTPNIKAFSDDYGSEILNNEGILTMMIRCSERTSDAWYPTIRDVSGMIPDFTPYF